MKKNEIVATVVTALLISSYGVLIGAVIGLSVDLHRASRGDLNHDGKVNIQDLSIMAAHWSKK